MLAGRALFLRPMAARRAPEKSRLRADIVLEDAAYRGRKTSRAAVFGEAMEADGDGNGDEDDADEDDSGASDLQLARLRPPSLLGPRA